MNENARTVSTAVCLVMLSGTVSYHGLNSITPVFHSFSSCSLSFADLLSVFFVANVDGWTWFLGPFVYSLTAL